MLLLEGGLLLLTAVCPVFACVYARYELGTINRTANLASLHTTRNGTERPFGGRLASNEPSCLHLGLMNCLFPARHDSGPSFRRARHDNILMTDLS